MFLAGLGCRAAGSPELAAAYREQEAKTRRQRRLLAQHLKQLGSRPAVAKDAGLALGGCAWSAIWAAQRDTPAKLLCFMFAAVHLEFAASELLRREAGRAGDARTEALAERLGGEEHAAADRLAALFDAAVEATHASGRR